MLQKIIGIDHVGKIIKSKHAIIALIIRALFHFLVLIFFIKKLNTIPGITNRAPSKNLLINAIFVVNKKEPIATITRKGVSITPKNAGMRPARPKNRIPERSAVLSAMGPGIVCARAMMR